MAGRKKSHSGSRKFTLPIAPLAGLAAGMAAPASHLLAGNVKQAANWLAYNYVGVAGIDTGQPYLDLRGLKNGLLPLGVGVFVHWAASKFGVNRALGRAGVPVIRI